MIGANLDATGLTRVERDTLGEMHVLRGALWGAQTQRAVENFPISGLRFGRRLIHALGVVKQACARANLDLGLLTPELGQAIIVACDDVISGAVDAHFPIDVFQTGSGTSTNMNANEVIASLVSQRGGMDAANHPPEGAVLAVHPNDHVNMSQSSNDVIPTTIHVALTLALRDALIPALETLAETLDDKAQAFDGVVKTGRTHLQDATPIRMGQVFGGYAAQVRLSIGRARQAIEALTGLPLGGTAVGTGVNCPAGFPAMAIGHLNRALDTTFREAENHIEANAARDGLVEASGALKTIAVSLHKIANDIRWMGSGPRNGLGELRLPAVQPGSSIMPGKVNPVIAESLIMVCAQVIGYDVANTLGGLGGAFEINLMMPLLAHNTVSSAEMLANAARLFGERCVAGVEVDAERCEAALARNLSLATALAPAIGYDRAAQIAKAAEAEDITVREAALRAGVLSPDELDTLLDPRRMTEPGR